MNDYKLATTDTEYQEAALLAGLEPDAFMFPTFIAYRGNEVVGTLGTQNRQDMVVAGPLAIAGHIENKGILAFRLADLYERFMARLGIVEYLVHVDPGNDSMQGIMKKLPFESIEDTENGHWYRRAL